MRNKLVLCLFLLFILALNTLYAQEPFQSIIENPRNSNYNVNVYNRSQVLPLDDGGYMIKDYLSKEVNSSFVSARITKFNKCHNKVWSKIIDSIYVGILGMVPIIQEHSMIKTSDNCFISSNLISTDNTYPLVVKFDSNGNKIWGKVLYSATHKQDLPQYGSQVCMPSTNGSCVIALMGYVTDSFPNGFVNITKLDRNGVVTNSYNITSKVPDFFPNLFIINILKMPLGGFLVSLGSEKVQNNYQYMLRIDSLGNLTWFKRIDNPIINIKSPITDNNFTSDRRGNIYITGGYYVKPNIYLNYIKKTDANGNPLWCKYINDPHDGSNPKDYYIQNIGISDDDNFAAIFEYFDGYGSKGYFHGYYIKFDANDNVRFAKLIKNNNYSFNDYSANISGEMAVSNNDGILVLGNSNVDPTTFISNSLTLAKYDNNGNSQCLGKDTTLLFSNLNFTTSSQTVINDTGFISKDAKVAVKNGTIKERIICSSTFYPIADLGGDTVLCTADSFLLSIGKENIGAKFKWSTGDTLPTIIVTKSGKYWVKLTSGFCTSSDTANLVFYKKIMTGLSKNFSVCLHDSVLLEPADTTIHNYYWVAPNKSITNGPKIMAKDSGYYYLMLSGTKSCSALDTVHLKFFPLPSASAGPDTILCRDQIYTMEGAGGITYLWKPSTYLSSATDPNAKAELPNTQPFMLVVTNSQGCKDSAQVLLRVRPLLQVKISGDTTICYRQSIELYATAQGGDSLQYHFSWPYDSLLGDSIIIKPNMGGWHKVVLSDNCTPTLATDSVYITVIPPPKAEFTFIPGNPVNTNHNVNFINKSQNASRYLWNFNDKDSSKLTSQVYIFTDSGNYKVMLVAYSTNGCPNDTAFGNIKAIEKDIAIFIPNSFTPNGDGINDFFNINGTGIKSYSYDIYNRWGEHLYSSSSDFTPAFGGGQGAGWDGSFRGVPVIESVYLYVLDVLDIEGTHHFLSGTITLLR